MPTETIQDMRKGWGSSSSFYPHLRGGWACFGFFALGCIGRDVVFGSRHTAASGSPKPKTWAHPAPSCAPLCSASSGWVVMASMLVNRAGFATRVVSVSDEGGFLERFNGLRKQAFVSTRRGSVGLSGARAGDGSGEAARVAGPVCSTSLRPGRYVKEQGGSIIPVSPEDGRINFLEEEVKVRSFESVPDEGRGGMWVKPSFQRKTKIVCTIGPTSNTKEMIWKLAAEGMNVARLNMSHGDHASHKKVIDLVREFNKEANSNVIALMLDTKGPEVRSGDLPQPIWLKKGDPFTFTIKRGVGTDTCVSVNYDDFVNDVEGGDTLLIDGGMMSLEVKSKTHDSVLCEVVDGGELKSRRHLNVRGKSATLPSITEKDWEDIKFGVENKVDFYALSFVKDAEVVHELKAFLKEKSADIHVIVKIESADSIPNLQSILDAADGAMVARGDLGAELPIEEVPLLQGEIIRSCRAMGKPVIVATNMLESMITHPTPTRAEVSDIAIAVREGADAVMLSGETAHGKYPLKAVRVMHTVAMRTEATMPEEEAPANLGRAFKTHMSEMFAFHATLMSNTLGTSICVFTRSGFMALLLSHYRPAGTIFAFTNDKKVQSRLALYHGVRALHIHFTNDAEETFVNALSILQKRGMVQDGEEVALVQSGRQPIWRAEYTHHIQVRKVRA